MSTATQAFNSWVQNLRHNRRLSPATISAYSHAVAGFLGEEADTELEAACTQARVNNWMAGMMRAKAAKGEPAVSKRSRRQRLSALGNFIDYCRFHGWLAESPISDLHRRSVRTASNEHVPTGVPSKAEMAKLLDSVDTSTAMGLRDRAILETLYGTGARVSELAGITLEHFYRGKAQLRLIGKGNKVRTVPLGAEAMIALNNYCDRARDALLANEKGCTHLFISERHKPMSRQAIWYRVKHYARLAGLSNAVSPHTFRHAYATHMIEADAELRAVQTLLGHSSVTTTAVYTHVANDRLAETHARHHPRGG